MALSWHPGTLTPHPPDDDPSLLLIEKIQAGVDYEESCRKLYELHFRKVLAFFLRKRFSPEESRDFTQEVFSRVFKAIDTFRRESRFERWLFEIATNIFRNEIRRKSAEKRDAVERSIDVPSDDPDSPGSIDLRSEDPSALERMVNDERKSRLRKALQELPDQMRKCCVLRYERGLKYKEIAVLMKISIETVKAHLHQARKRLEEMLGDPPEGGAPKRGGRE